MNVMNTFFRFLLIVSLLNSGLCTGQATKEAEKLIFQTGFEDSSRVVTPDGQPKQVVYAITHFTHNTSDPPPNGFTGYNPMKLYTSKQLVSYVKARGKHDKFIGMILCFGRTTARLT